MYVIKMNSDKSLMTTVQSTIFCGENNADTLLFLIPSEYNKIHIANCDVTLEYISVDGIKTESLELMEEEYKGYLQYHLKIDSEFTEHPGRISLSLIIEGNDGFTLKSGDIYVDIHSQSEDDIPENKKYELEVRVNEIAKTTGDLSKDMGEFSKELAKINEDIQDTNKKLDDYDPSKEIDEKIGNIDLAVDTLLAIQKELWGESV